MMNEGRPVLQVQPIAMSGRYLEWFFVNEKPLGSCLPTPGLILPTQPYSQARSTKHLLAPFLFSSLSVSISVAYSRFLMSR